MLSRRAYYLLKPYIPWSLRVSVRRFFAERKRKHNRASWPIDQSAARVPAGWNGWPEEKEFALVLTHDVEGPEGLAKVRQLAELELSLGFRSSFNFVPEGSYRVSNELRQWLLSNGFEVGVHDLNHDGKLFDTAEDFQNKARRINQYIADWDTVGFRAGFMLRNLAWLHTLNIEYDASTFDTDPFEPQSDGAGTIFPFWISEEDSVNPPGVLAQNAAAIREKSAMRGNRTAADRGYVELPYTLPQDSTLFLVFREPSAAIWKNKTDWIAQHHGMVLVNVHPDGIAFDGEKVNSRTYPVERYESFLVWLKEKYSKRYWHKLPREVAQLVRPSTLSRSR